MSNISDLPVKLFILLRIPSPSFRFTRGISNTPPVCGEEKYAGCVISGMLFVCFFFVLVVLKVKHAPIIFLNHKGTVVVYQGFVKVSSTSSRRTSGSMYV